MRQKAHAKSVEQLLKLGSDVNSQLKDEYNHCPSTLIAVCATEKLEDKDVTQTVKVLLDHGANPSLTCVMLTEQENKKLSDLNEELAKDTSRAHELRILSKIPQEWFKPRNAADFASKNNYITAAAMIRQAIKNQQTKGLTDGQSDNHQPDNF